MCELSDFETELISSGDLIFNCGTQLLLQKGQVEHALLTLNPSCGP